MHKLLLVFLLASGTASLAEAVQCPKGYQPFADRCVTQRMADYISCVDASGGNRQEIIEDLHGVDGSKYSAGLTGSGSGIVAKGKGSLLLGKSAETALARRLETRWFPNGMSECAKVLDGSTLKALKKEAASSRRREQQMLSRQKELKLQQDKVLEHQGADRKLLLESKEMLLSVLSRLERTREAELLRKYPLGYCLFAADTTSIVVPNESVLVKRWRIDWNAAKVLSLDASKVALQLPNFADQNQNVYAEHVVVLDRKIGATFSPLEVTDAGVVVEILDDTGNGIIAVIGFKRPRPRS